MKKISVLIAVLAFLVSNLQAQEDERSESSKLQFGFKIGANMSNVYDTRGEEFRADAKFGLAAGAFFSIPIGEYIGIQPEVMFSQKGYQTTGNIIGVGYEYRLTSNFIDIPLLLAIKPVPFVTLLAGPQFSYLLSEKRQFNNSITDPVVQERDFENDNVRKNTLGFVFGLDFNIDRAVIGARAGYDILNNNGDGTQTTPRYKNAYYQATLGYRF